MSKIYAIGETVLDILFRHDQPFAAKAGGACLDSAITLGRLGLPIYFISEYGIDRSGHFIDNFLRQNNVNTDFVYKYAEGRTSLALAFLDENSNADYEFYKSFPRKRLDIIWPDIQEDDILLFGSFYAINTDVRNHLMTFIEKARHNNAIIIYDPNFRKQHLTELGILRPLIEENISLATIVRGSDEDFSLIYNTDNADEVVETINSNPLYIIYTKSADGISLRSKNISADFPVKEIVPVSTIGAGDNFNAGIVYSLYKNHLHYRALKNLAIQDWKQIIDTAVDFAAHVCQSYDNYISPEFAKGFKL